MQGKEVIWHFRMAEHNCIESMGFYILVQQPDAGSTGQMVTQVRNGVGHLRPPVISVVSS